MPLTLNDVNFYSLTRDEAQKLETEFDQMYPDMNKTPVASNVNNTFYENHKYMVLGVGAVVLWSYYGHTQLVTQMNRRQSILF